MIHSKEINACFRNHLISSSFIILFSQTFAPRITHKRELTMAVQIARIFAEIMYNDNKGNSNSFHTSRYNTHNAYKHDIGNNTSIGNRGNINEIVIVSSYPSINA